MSQTRDASCAHRLSSLSHTAMRAKSESQANRKDVAAGYFWHGDSTFRASASSRGVPATSVGA
eukprot:1295627-Amphidinium_carterae.1